MKPKTAKRGKPAPPAKKGAKKRGAPSTYNVGMADRICRLIAKGKSLQAISETKGFPDADTIRAWLTRHPEFLGNYARAREQQADYYADEMVEIADTAKDSNKARLQIDARKWKASKLAPKKYGDKLDITTRDETPPVSRAELVEMLRKSPALLAEYEAMIAEAKA